MPIKLILSSQMTFREILNLNSTTSQLRFELVTVIFIDTANSHKIKVKLYSTNSPWICKFRFDILYE